MDCLAARLRGDAKVIEKKSFAKPILVNNHPIRAVMGDLVNRKHLFLCDNFDANGCAATDAAAQYLIRETISAFPFLAVPTSGLEARLIARPAECCNCGFDHVVYQNL